MTSFMVSGMVKLYSFSSYSTSMLGSEGEVSRSFEIVSEEHCTFHRSFSFWSNRFRAFFDSKFIALLLFCVF